MKPTFNSVAVAVISIAIVTTLVLPRKDKKLAVPEVLKTLEQYVSGSMRSMLGTDRASESRPPRQPPRLGRPPRAV